MKKEKLRLIVLSPHRDAAKIVDEYKQKLFANGFSLAYAFPSLIPLMITKKPYTLIELKDTARALRKTMLIDNEKGRFISRDAEIIDFLPNAQLGGCSFLFSLDNFSLLQKDDIPLPRFVLGLSLVKSAEEEAFLRFAKENPLPPVSFTACSIANMLYHYSENGVYSWEIGHPVWLPKSNMLKRIDKAFNSL